MEIKATRWAGIFFLHSQIDATETQIEAILFRGKISHLKNKKSQRKHFEHCVIYFGTSPTQHQTLRT